MSSADIGLSVMHRYCPACLPIYTDIKTLFLLIMMQKNVLVVIYTDIILDLRQLLLNCELCLISPFKGSLQTLCVY